MPSDIPADVAYIGGVWCEAVLYGFHLIVYAAVCNILLKRRPAYSYGSSMVLIAFSTIMFAVSTAHASLAVHELLQGFIYQRDLPGGPPAYFRANVFPTRKAMYIINTILGDSLLIWRVYMIWGRNWKICLPSISFLLGTIICGIRTIVANFSPGGPGSVFTPVIFAWITSTFVLTICAQITATGLIAGRIYLASRALYYPSDSSHSDYSDEGGSDSNEKKTWGSFMKWGRNRKRRTSKSHAAYSSLMWLVVESGAVYTAAAIIQLVTYLEKMNAGVIMEFVLSQLSAMVPTLIVVRVGLGLAHDGSSTWVKDRSNHRERQQQLTSFRAAVPPGEKGVDLRFGASSSQIGQTSVFGGAGTKGGEGDVSAIEA